MDSGNSSSKLSTAESPPGSWAKNTSAGLFLPSSSSVAANSGVPAYFTTTSSPVSSWNCWTNGPTNDSDRPEYTVRGPPSPPPQATSPVAAATSTAMNEDVNLKKIGFVADSLDISCHTMCLLTSWISISDADFMG